MARKRKASDAPALASANPAQAIPTAAKVDIAVLFPGLRPRHDGWTQTRTQRFLDVLAHTGCIEDAARVAGLSATGARRMKRKYPLFEEAWDDALSRAQLGLVAIAYARAVDGRETVIIRKGEEYERRISPSDSMLGLLIKRGDMAGGALPKSMQDLVGLSRDQIITFADWRANKRFDHKGRRFELPDPSARAEAFANKMSTIRRRLEEYAENHGLCPTCSQEMKPGWTEGDPMAILVARGVVDPEELG